MSSNKFEFDYHAPSSEERKEIKSIRNQYLPKDEHITKLDRIRTLNSRVTSIPLIVSLSLGVFGCLIFGTGMCFFLEWIELWVWGIPVAVFGTIIMLIAYPFYLFLSKKLKAKYGEEIIKLADELMIE